MRHLAWVSIAVLGACGGGEEGDEQVWEHGTSGDWVVAFKGTPCGTEVQLEFHVEPGYGTDFATGDEVPVLDVSFADTWQNCDFVGAETPTESAFRCCLDAELTCNQLEVALSDDGTEARAVIARWTSPTDPSCTLWGEVAQTLARVR